MNPSVKAVSNSALFEAYERAAADPALRDALLQVGIALTIEHNDTALMPVRFGADAESPGRSTIRIVLESTAFAERFWAGREPLVHALVDRQLTIYGPVNRIMEMVGVLPLLFASLAK